MGNGGGKGGLECGTEDCRERGKDKGRKHWEREGVTRWERDSAIMVMIPRWVMTLYGV